MATLRHVTMVAKFLDLNRPWSCKYGRKKDKIDMYDFPEHDCTQQQNVSGCVLPSFDNENGRLCQERVLRSRNHVTMVTRRHAYDFRPNCFTVSSISIINQHDRKATPSAWQFLTFFFVFLPFFSF